MQDTEEKIETAETPETPEALDEAAEKKIPAFPRSIMKRDEDIPFAWKNIVLVDKRSNAGKIMSKIKQEAETKSRMPEKNG